MTEMVLYFENLNFFIFLYNSIQRSHIHHYFPPTALSCHKLPTYVDAYKHYLWLKPCSDTSAKKLTTEKIILF